MRLQRCVQVAVGLAASSSVVILLSGSAFAASNSKDTVVQNGQTKTVSASSTKTTVTAPVGSVDASGSTGGGDVAPSNGADQQGAQVDQSGNSTAQTNGDNATTVVQTGTTVSDPNSANASVAALAAGKGDGGSGDAASAGGGSTQAAPANHDNISPQSTPSEVDVVASVANPASSAPAQHTVVLRIQPVITNRTADVAQDLAANVPTAPAPAHAPTPAKSSGLLGALVVNMANVLVPQPLLASADVAYRIALPVSVATLVILLINVFAFSYGLWLRRGGFVTAARSDAPMRGVTSSFATPLLLGYVTSPPDLHNPILMVAETKTRTNLSVLLLRKEVMR